MTEALGDFGLIGLAVRVRFATSESREAAYSVFPGHGPEPDPQRVSRSLIKTSYAVLTSTSADHGFTVRISRTSRCAEH
jgi:hypothetical protein